MVDSSPCCRRQLRTAKAFLSRMRNTVQPVDINASMASAKREADVAVLAGQLNLSTTPSLEPDATMIFVGAASRDGRRGFGADGTVAASAVLQTADPSRSRRRPPLERVSQRGSTRRPADLSPMRTSNDGVRHVGPAHGGDFRPLDSPPINNSEAITASSSVTRHACNPSVMTTEIRTPMHRRTQSLCWPSTFPMRWRESTASPIRAFSGAAWSDIR